MPASPSHLAAAENSYEADRTIGLTAYFDGLQQGVIASNERGRVVVETAPARAILGGLGCPATFGTPARPLLRVFAKAVGIATGTGWREMFWMLRHIRKEGSTAIREITVEDRILWVRIRPMPEGWTVALEDVTADPPSASRRPLIRSC